MCKNGTDVLSGSSQQELEHGKEILEVAKDEHAQYVYGRASDHPKGKPTKALTNEEVGA